MVAMQQRLIELEATTANQGAIADLQRQLEAAEAEKARIAAEAKASIASARLIVAGTAAGRGLSVLCRRGALCVVWVCVVKDDGVRCEGSGC